MWAGEEGAKFNFRATILHSMYVLLNGARIKSTQNSTVCARLNARANYGTRTVKYLDVSSRSDDSGVSLKFEGPFCDNLCGGLLDLCVFGFYRNIVL